MAKYNEKQNKWTQDYNKRAYDDIKVRVPKGKREAYKRLAEVKCTSLNQLIVELLDEEIKKENMIMKKLVDRMDKEVCFYNNEIEKARQYFEVEGNTLEEIADNANEKDKENETGWSDRYSVVEVQ